MEIHSIYGCWELGKSSKKIVVGNSMGFSTAFFRVEITKLHTIDDGIWGPGSTSNGPQGPTDDWGSYIPMVKSAGFQHRLFHDIPTILYCTVLYYSILYCTVLYYTILYCTILYCTVLYYTILYCTVLYYTILYCTVLYYTVLYCTVLYCTVLYYTILYCTVLYYTVLYCTILYCTVLYCAVLHYTILYCTVLYYTILYCTVLYYTVLYCTVLYCTVLYYTILWLIPFVGLMISVSPTDGRTSMLDQHISSMKALWNPHFFWLIPKKIVLLSIPATTGM